jgi:hypothetical protein
MRLKNAQTKIPAYRAQWKILDGRPEDRLHTKHVASLRRLEVILLPGPGDLIAPESVIFFSGIRTSAPRPSVYLTGGRRFESS